MTGSWDKCLEMQLSSLMAGGTPYQMAGVNQRQWWKECKLKLKIKNMPNSKKKKKSFISQQSFCACIRCILQNCNGKTFSRIQIP